MYGREFIRVSDALLIRLRPAYCTRVDTELPTHLSDKIHAYITCYVSGGPLSHPIVHLSHQAGAILPQAEVEEEIRDTPLRYTQALPSAQQTSVAPGAWPKDMPRLAFEITSEDGFSCRAQSMEGKSTGSFIKDAH